MPAPSMVAKNKNFALQSRAVAIAGLRRTECALGWARVKQLKAGQN